MASGGPRHLLFLVADTGGGHRASAAAVARRLTAGDTGRYAVHLLDPFADASPRPLGTAAALYSPLIRRAPWLWGALYHATNSRPAVAALRTSALRLVEPGLRDALAAVAPAAVVSFHPLLTAAAVRLRGASSVPVITVITDLVDVHAAWVCAGVDAVVTATPGALDRCRRAGIPAERCHDLGLPVDERFTAEAPAGAARRELRVRLGLDPDAFTVLLLGGGEGSGGLDRLAMALLRGTGVQVAVICGRNRALQERLEAVAGAHPRRLTVCGFVEDMPDWMGAADLCATKAGPGTIVEALCRRLPLLLTSHLPGQERGNVEFVVENGVGRYVPHPSALVDAVRELSAPGAPGLVAMRDALIHAARPLATARIAALVDRLACHGHGAPVDAA